MFLIRRLVVRLDKLNDRGNFPTLGFYVRLAAEGRWPRVNYIFDSNKDFELRVKKVLEDNLGSNPDKHFIDYEDLTINHPVRERLKVTALGRKLIEWRGFWNEVFKRYDHLSKVLIGIITGGVIVSIFQFSKRLWDLSLEKIFYN